MSDPTDTWEWFTASLPAGYTSGQIYTACSDGDTWVGFGDVSGSSGDASAIAVGDSGGEEWVMQIAYSLPSGGFIFACAYGDGQWVGVGGVPGGSPETVIVSTTDPAGTWTVDTHSFEAIATGVAYGEGVWTLITQSGKVYTATDPAGEWTLAHTVSASIMPGTYARLAFDSGTWVFAYQAAAAPYYIHVYSATDPNGTWTSRGSFDGVGSAAGIGNSPDGWFVIGDSTMGSKADLGDASWTVTSGLPATGTNGPGLAYGDGYYIACSASVYYLDVRIATSLTGPYTPIDSTEPGGFGMFLFGGPYFNGDSWVVVGDRGYDNNPGVLAPPSGAGEGWGLLL